MRTGTDPYSYTLYYLYDDNGDVIGFKKRATGGGGTYSYYYVKNLQGDVVELRSYTGTLVASYSYDAWGNITSIKNGSGADVSGNSTP